MKTEAVVLKLTGNALFDAGFRIPGDTDWQAVYEECKKQTVTVLGFCSAKQAEGLDPEVRKQWEKDVAFVAFHNYRVTFSHQNLHRMMEDAGIPYVILKGLRFCGVLSEADGAADGGCGFPGLQA